MVSTRMRRFSKINNYQLGIFNSFLLWSFIKVFLLHFLCDWKISICSWEIAKIYFFILNYFANILWSSITQQLEISGTYFEHDYETLEIRCLMFIILIFFKTLFHILFQRTEREFQKWISWPNILMQMYSWELLTLFPSTSSYSE